MFKRHLEVILAFMAVAALCQGRAEAGKWDAWKYRMPIVLTRRDARTAGLIPVDVTFSLFADRCKAPEREIRLVLETPEGEKEVPFQLSRLTRWTKDTDGEKSLPTLNGMITFFDTAPGGGDARYFLLYGNPSAEAPEYPTDLKVTGEGPAWTIENGGMTVRLHKSGQISSVTLKSNPDTPIAPQTERMHWNPGVYVPTRHWAHAFDWDPPEKYELEKGPLFVEIRRSGVFPKIRDVHLSITYRIFAGRTFIESGTVLRVLDDIGVVALRNDELVFDEGFFTHAAWGNPDGPAKIIRLDEYEPVNTHGDILRLPDTTPFVTLFDPAKGVGAASVRMELSKIDPGGGPPVLFDNSTYIANGHYQYWFRPLVYFHVGWDRKQLITVPEGSIYSERNLYLFYEPKPGGTPVEEVVELSRAAGEKPLVNIGGYVLPPGE